MRLKMFHSILGLALLCGNAMAQEATPQAAAPAPEAAAEAPAAATPAEATTPAPASQPEAEAAPAPTATAPAAPGVIGAPPDGKGQIVFFREKKFTGSAIRYKVREGTNELGKLSSGTYFVVPVEPGTHEYVVHSEAKDVLTLEVEAGETHYVQGTVTMGFLAGHPNLSPSDEATFQKMSAKLELAK